MCVIFRRLRLGSLPCFLDMYTNCMHMYVDFDHMDEVINAEIREHATNQEHVATPSSRDIRRSPSPVFQGTSSSQWLITTTA